MQQLPAEFTARYFRYIQIERQGDIVLVRRIPKTSGHVTHEVAIISVEPAHVSAAGFEVPDTEAYPASDEGALDRTLWRYDSLRDAEQQFKRVVGRAAQAATDQPAPVVVVHAGLQEDAGESGPP
jgi:hypothetical protein